VPNGEVVIILERSVTAPFWQHTFKVLQKKIEAGVHQKVHGTGVVKVMFSTVERMYVLLVNESPVAWLALVRKSRWVAYEVTQVWVFPELRGLGLAQRLYKAAVNNDRLLVASGVTQSKSSRALWKSFIEKDTFKIWAQDFKNLDVHAGVEYHDDELHCVLPVYVKEEHPIHDVRLLAYRNP
jgi:GNAT superfamily N-acetyltransferase